MKFFNWIGNLFPKAHTAGGASVGGLGNANWSTRDYANFAKEAYIKSFVGYRCIQIIAQSVASVPWKVFKQDDSQRIEQPNHSLMRILHRANPQEGFSAFQLGVISFLGIAGNSFIEKLAPETGPNKGLPLELHKHRPDQIKYILNEDTKELIGYSLERDGKLIKQWPIDPITGQSDLLQIKLFHPINDIEGLSPVEPGSKSIDTSNEALTWNKKLLQNEARPGMIIISENTLGDDQYKRLKKQLRTKTAGAENAGNSLLLEGGIKDVKPFMLSPKEMDFLKGNWDLVRQVSLTFGVPPQILGVPGDSTFANFEQARLYLWETTVFFYLMLLRDEYNNWFFSEDDKIFIDYILDDVPALAPRRQEHWDMIEKSTIMTINEKREALGQEATPGGDVILVPANMIPLEMAGITEEEVDDSESDIEGIEEEDETEEETGLNLKVV